MEKNQHGVVNLDYVSQNNIVYIDLGTEQKDSIFTQQYQKAAKVISDIIRKGNEALEDSVYCRACVHKECAACIHREEQFACREQGSKNNLTSFHTAVPFIGDRGTGKTSVMKSVMERLRNYNGYTEHAAFNLGLEFNDTKFVVFEMIDAAIMKTTDDVMEIMLARMLTYLEDFATDNGFRDLYRRINDLHHDLCLVSDDKRGKREEYGLMALQRVADSQKAVEEFRKLVKEFLLTIGKYKFNGRRCYLVIALDDVDMYQGSAWGMKDSQFALLEHVYVHLRIPGLIVLMTYNEHLLRRACNRHFEWVYFGRRIQGAYTPTEEREINALTSQFVSKLFPQEKRIYMPNYMRVDALDRPNLYVSPVFEGKRLKPFSENETCLTAKEFMLRLIAYRTDVYFDAAGTKKHFFEPRNLREFGALFQIIRFTEEVEGDPETKEIIKGRNRQELLKYLSNQFAQQYLNDEERGRFEDLMALPLLRQNRTLIDQIRQQRRTIITDPDERGYLFGQKEDRWRYSYGELLHNFYFSTRIPKTMEGEDFYFRKEYMHCIFGTQSVQMNEAVCNSGSAKKIMEIIGSSVAGRWANDMLPKVRMQGYGDTSGAGSISIPIRDFFGWEIPDNVLSVLKRLNEDEPYKGPRGWKINPLAHFMRALVTAGMFFSNYPTEGLGLHLEPDGDDEQIALCLCSDSKEHVCFNVMNFSINLYAAENYLTFIQRKLRKLGDDLAKQLQEDWASECAILQKEMETFQGVSRYTKSPKMMELAQRRKSDVKERLERAFAWHALQQALGSRGIPEKVQELPEEVKKPPEEANNEYRRFGDRWQRIVDSVIDEFWDRIHEWRGLYGIDRWVLPVQNVDMMYNINKRLANVSYHDIPADADVSEVYKNYKRLYIGLAEELENQDEAYATTGADRFSDAFRNCVFYRIITESDQYQATRAFLDKILVEMVSSAIRSQRTRSDLMDISL